LSVTMIWYMGLLLCQVANVEGDGRFSSSAASCSSICPPGKHVVAPDLMVPRAGATCAQIEGAAAQGAYSRQRCSFLGGFLGEQCCATSSSSGSSSNNNDSNHSKLPPPNTSGKPKPSDSSKATTKCYYVAVSPTLRNPVNRPLCIEDLGMKGICFATLIGHACSSCLHQPAGTCVDFDTQGGYAMDCSSDLHPEDKDIHLCDHDQSLPLAPSTSTTHHSSNHNSKSGSHHHHRNHNNSSQSDSYTDVPVFMIFVVAICISWYANMGQAPQKDSKQHGFAFASVPDSDEPRHHDDIELSGLSSCSTSHPVSTEVPMATAVAVSQVDPRRQQQQQQQQQQEQQQEPLPAFEEDGVPLISAIPISLDE